MRNSWLLITPTLALVAMLWACGGDTGVSTDGPQVGKSLPEGQAQGDETPDSAGEPSPSLAPVALPAFPPPVGQGQPLLRGSSAQTLGGNDWTQEYGAANRAGTTPTGYVIIPGGGDDLAWAMYSLGGLTEDRPSALAIEVQAAPITPGGDDELPLRYWVGLSNYSKNLWEWQGPFDKLSSLTLNSATLRDRYVSAQGEFSFVILCDSSGVVPSPLNPDGLAAVEVVVSTPEVLAVTDAAYQSTIPIYPEIDYLGVGASAQGHAGSRASSAIGDPQVEMQWTHVFDPGDPNAEAFGYRIYRKGPNDLNRIPIGNGDPSGIYIDPDDNFAGVGPPTAGLTYEYSIRAYNSNGWTPFSAQNIYIAGANVLPPLDADTLYAVPSATTVEVGDPVTIQVATGQPANDLQYLNSVRVTVENAGTYVPNSFNVGAPGGSTWGSDGYWTLLGPPVASFVNIPDSFFTVDTDLGLGMHAYDFNVSPNDGAHGPAQVGDGAALFNFELSFSAPGVYHLGFQQFESVDRTFYQDGVDLTHYYWGVLDNSFTITVNPGTGPPPLPSLDADTLYAIPWPATVAVGEPVTIQIATGQPASDLQYVNGVRMTVENTAAYVADSLNMGAPGGSQKDIDGFWSFLGPPTDFLLPPDSFITATDIGGGISAWDFNVVPLGGPFAPPANVGTGAALFNFEMTFSAAGVYHLGFQEFETVKRTYYSDGSATEFNWGALDSTYTITVN